MQTWNKDETLHHPEFFLHQHFSLKSQHDPLKQKIIARKKRRKKRFCDVLHHRAFLKITKLSSKAKNYRMTKKKVVRAYKPSKKFLQHPKIFLQLLPQNFTPLPKILHHPGW